MLHRVGELWLLEENLQVPAKGHLLKSPSICYGSIRTCTSEITGTSLELIHISGSGPGRVIGYANFWHCWSCLLPGSIHQPQCPWLSPPPLFLPILPLPYPNLTCSVVHPSVHQDQWESSPLFTGIANCCTVAKCFIVLCNSTKAWCTGGAYGLLACHLHRFGP